MTLSYAQAMKEKHKPPPTDVASNTARRNNSNMNVKQSPVLTKTESSSQRKAPPLLIKTERTDTVKPFAWGKQNNNPTAWGTKSSSSSSTTIITGPKTESPTLNHSSQSSVKQDISHKKNGWKSIATYTVKPTTKKQQSQQPITILSSSSRPHQTQKAKKKAPQPLPVKKSNKPKSSRVSIHDLIAPKRKNNTSNKTSKGTSISKQTTTTPKPLQVNSNFSSDFPPLSLSSNIKKQKNTKPINTKPKLAPALSSTKKFTAVAKAAVASKPPKKPSIAKEEPLSSLAMFFNPKKNEKKRDGGDEHALLKLMEERTVYQKKGRQRVAPRKKKFTALKKKVLHERLAKWRAVNPEPNDDKLPSTNGTCSICIYNYFSSDDMEDDDEYEEVVENLVELATKIGPIAQVFVPRISEKVFVQFEAPQDVSAAIACWNGLVIGGKSLHAMEMPEFDNSSSSWKEQMMATESSLIEKQEKEEGGGVVVVIKNVLTEDDYQDSDCMEESLSYLQELAQQFGSITNIQKADHRSVHMTCETAVAANTVASGLSSTVLSGHSLQAHVQSQETPATTATIVILENILTPDDLEDPDCLDETLNDVQKLAVKYGDIDGLSTNGTTVHISFLSKEQAQTAVLELNGLVLGGVKVCASVKEDQELSTKKSNDNVLYLQNVLTQDDLEDEDCLEETLADIRQLVTNYDGVSIFDLEVIEGIVKIVLESDNSLLALVSGLDGMVLGGQIVTASRCMPGEEETNTANSNPQQEEGLPIPSFDAKRKSTGQSPSPDEATKKARTSDKKPLYSGDKLIPELFAECKRVPKIPNAAAGPRDYAKLVNDERVRPLLTEMLSELMRLQKRAMEYNKQQQKNNKARRRIVMGLREVARGIRAHKVKMVVMANNLDEYGAIDEKLQEIIDLARKEDVPLFFEFTKRSLGKAIGKSIKVAVVGIQNADGAHQPFKKLVSIATKF
jgi:selenocysteine insertion sequence-binding protein 2